MIKDVRCVLFACIPPTFAAALIIISGFIFEIKFFVSSNKNRSASFLVALKTFSTFFELLRILVKELPTKPPRT